MVAEPMQTVSKVLSMLWRGSLLLAILACGWVAIMIWNRERAGADQPATTQANQGPNLRLADGSNDTVVVSEGSARRMGLTSVSADRFSESQVLRLTGQLMLDPGRLVHVHARFPGEVVRFAAATGSDDPSAPRVGDRVEAGQLLAVIWSPKIGETKSDLVDALSRLKLHEVVFANRKQLEGSGALPLRIIEEAQRSYESDLIEVERLRRTLHSWRLNERHLSEVEVEAQRIHQEANRGPLSDSSARQSTSEMSRTWAEMDIVSPLAGVILEKNIAIGDMVNSDQDLYKIADLSRLMVMANVYDDDLPALTALPPSGRTWEVRATSQPDQSGFLGAINSISNVIDPNQHTAIVRGWIDNSRGELRVGQFIEATVKIPLSAATVAIPITALVDRGEKKYVFVAIRDSTPSWQRREIDVLRRTATTAVVSATPDRGIQPGEQVLTSGVLELSAALDSMRPIDP